MTQISGEREPNKDGVCGADCLYLVYGEGQSKQRPSPLREQAPCVSWQHVGAGNGKRHVG